MSLVHKNYICLQDQYLAGHLLLVDLKITARNHYFVVKARNRQYMTIIHYQVLIPGNLHANVLLQCKKLIAAWDRAAIQCECLIPHHIVKFMMFKLEEKKITPQIVAKKKKKETAC